VGLQRTNINYLGKEINIMTGFKIGDIITVHNRNQLGLVINVRPFERIWLDDDGDDDPYIYNNLTGVYKDTEFTVIDNINNLVPVSPFNVGDLIEWKLGYGATWQVINIDPFEVIQLTVTYRNDEPKENFVCSERTNMSPNEFTLICGHNDIIVQCTELSVGAIYMDRDISERYLIVTDIVTNLDCIKTKEIGDWYNSTFYDISKILIDRGIYIYVGHQEELEEKKEYAVFVREDKFSFKWSSYGLYDKKGVGEEVVKLLTDKHGIENIVVFPVESIIEQEE
jgi:hypothetical protein